MKYIASNENPQQQISKIVITNDASGNPSRETLGNFETDMRKLSKVANEAMNNLAYFSAKVKEINTETGKASYEMYVQRSELQNIMASLKSQNARWAESSHGSNYRIMDMPISYGTGMINIYGKQAQAKARAEISQIAGGQLISAPTNKNPDRFQFLLPLADGISSADKEWINQRKRVVFSGSMKLSREEAKRRAQEEEQLRIQEEEKKTAREILAIKQQYRDVERARLKNAKLIQKMEEDEAKEKASVEAQVNKYFADEKKQELKKEEKRHKEQKKREELEKKFEQEWLDAEARGEYDKWEKTDQDASKAMETERKQIAESSRKTAGIVKGAVAVLITIADLVRRILTSTLKNASKMDKEAVEARDVGITYSARRSMDIFDKAHGLPEGTTFSAVQATQGMFGDVTNLDKNAIGVLARVMGGKVSDFARAGLGESNPSLFVEEIIDAYFKQWKNGKNSLGQSVGQQQARMELMTSLNSVAPEYALLFSRMVDDYMSGAYGKFDSYGAWRATTETNRTSLTEADLTFSQEVGKKYNEILAIVEDLKTSFFTRLADSLDGILEKVRNIRLGMDAEKSLELDRSNYSKNEETKKQLRNAIGAYNASTASRMKQLNQLLPTSDPTDRRFFYSAETIAGILSGEIDEKYLKENVIEGSGMISQNASEVKAYLARGKLLAKSAMLDLEVSDEITRIWAIKEALKKIENEQAKGIGGKVSAIDFSISEETVEAQKKFKNVSQYVNQAYGSVNSPIAQEIVKKAYTQYLYDNPTEYEAMLYDLFGLDEYGNQITLNGVAIALANSKNHNYNYADVSKNKATAQSKLRSIYRQRKAELLQGTGRKELTPEEAKSLYIDIITEYDSMYFEALNRNILSGDTKGQAKWILGATESASVQNLNTSDSMIRGALVRSGVALPNGQYSYSGKNTEYGEYVITIVGKDEKSGKETKYSVSLGATKGQEVLGQFTMTDSGFDFTNTSLSQPTSKKK